MAAWQPGGLRAQGITMRPVTYMIMNGAPVLVLNDASLLSNGLVAPDNSTVIVTGVHSGRTVIGGTGTLLFNNLTVNKSASDVFLSGTVTVTGTLAMVSHNLQLNNHTLNLGGTGSISGEGSQSYITDFGTGTITATRVLSAPHAVNPGNIGVEISSSQHLGTVTVTRGEAQQALPTGVPGIGRYFAISPTVNSNLNASIRFHYLDAELDRSVESSLYLWSLGGKFAVWSYLGEDSINTTANWVLKTGIPSFSTRYSLFNSSNGTAIARTIPVSGSSFPGSSAAIVLKGYPNPVHNTVTLTMNSDHEADYTLSLYDQWGNILQSRELHCAVGTTTLQWDISRYPAGIYHISTGGAQPLKRITIIRQ